MKHTGARDERSRFVKVPEARPQLSPEGQALFEEMRDTLAPLGITQERIEGHAVPHGWIALWDRLGPDDRLRLCHLALHAPGT